MAFKKRKANGVAEATAPPENKRQRNAVEPTASSSRPSRTLAAAASPPRSTRSSISARSSPIKPVKKSVKSSAKEIPNGTVAASTIKKASKAKSIKRRAKGRKPADFVADGDDFNARPELEEQRSFTLHVCRRTPAVNKDEEAEDHDEGPSYWLMKAEPDSRIEKGKDVKFSIDDLNAATEPAGWDGVRNYVARNNMRLMMKGDMAFFYHSNCKVPGIVGTMEIVGEHSVDETAFNPEDPYYDEKSDRKKPKWCLVHVEFRRKFPEIIKLKEIQKFGKAGGVLENMQVLRQPRLSVSKVSKKEWNFIMDLAIEDTAAASAAHQPQMVA